MRLVVELLDRFLTLETGRVIYEEFKTGGVEEDEDEDAETVTRVPMGFTAIAPEGTADDEDEAPEVDCC